MLTRRQMILGSTLAATAVLADTAHSRPEGPIMYQAVRDFLATLDPEQKTTALLPFNSDERLNWHYVPQERKGLRYKAMNPEQQKAAHALLRIGLSSTGYTKVEAIRQLENVLRELENGSPIRD